MMDMSGAALLFATRATAAQFDPPEPPHRPDARGGEPPTVERARRAVRLQFMVDGALFGTVAARLPDIAARVDLGPGGLGVALAVAGASGLLTLPVAGALAGRWGTRALAVPALVLYAGAVPALALVGGRSALLVVLAVFGVGASGVHIATNAQASYVQRRAGRPLLSGLHAWCSVGGVLAAGVAVLLVPVVPLSAHLAAMALVLWVLAMGAVPRTLPEPPRLARTPLLVRPTRDLGALAAVAGLGFLAEDVTATFGPVATRLVAGGGALDAAVTVGAFSAAMVVVRLAGDRAVRRLGPATFLRMSGGLVVAGAALAVAWPVPAGTALAAAVIGCGVAGVAPVVLSLAAARVPHEPGPALAAVSSAGYLGGVAGPLAVGGLAALTGLRVAFVAVVMAGAVMVVLAGRTRVSAGDRDDAVTIP